MQLHRTVAWLALTLGLMVALAACSQASQPAAPTTAPKTGSEAPKSAASPAAAASPTTAAATKSASPGAPAVTSPSPAAKTAVSPSPAAKTGPSPSPSPLPPTPTVVVPSLLGGSPPAAPAGATCWDVVRDQTRASYIASENVAALQQVYENTATTTDVGGSLCLRDGQVVDSGQSRVLVGLGTLKTEFFPIPGFADRRDNDVRNRILRTDRYPVATYTIEGVEGAGPTFGTTDGPFTGKLTGKLKVLETELPVTWDVEGRVAGGVVTGTATTTVKARDFGIEPPASMLNVLAVQDSTKLKLEFTARRR